MGRRSQKSRTGQPKDRGKRAVADSKISDDNTGKSSEATTADSTEADDNADKPSEADNVVSTEVDNSAVKPSEADDVVSTAVDDNADKSSEVIKADNLDGDDGQPDSMTSQVPDGESAAEVVAGYTSIETDQNPQTRCSNCNTIFEVSPELLSSTDTRVRCGECLGIFDALANLRHLDDKDGDEQPSDSSGIGEEAVAEQSATGNEHSVSDGSESQDASEKGTAASDTSLDVTYADFSLFSADAALPDIDYLDEIREVPAFDFDDPGGDGELDETYSETMFAHGPEVDARSAINEADIGNAENDESAASDTREDGKDNSLTARRTATDDTLRSVDAPVSDTHTSEELDELDELVGSLRRPESVISVEESPTGSWWLRGALLLLVLVLVAALYAYRERESLQHNRTLRPALESLCSVIGCTLAEPVDLDSLQVLKRSVFSHPKLDNVLVINIGFVNQASFSQRFPVLEIRLTDRNGGLVVKNSFAPSDYLDNWQPGDVFDAGKRLDISLNVRDPGNRAMSFELNFR